MRKIKSFKWWLFSIPILTIGIVIVSLFAEDSQRTPAPAQKSSYLPVVDKETFSAVRNRMSKAKPGERTRINRRPVTALARRSFNAAAQTTVIDLNAHSERRSSV